MNSVLFASGNGEWTTPRWLFDVLDKEFGFNLDAAATKDNALCAKFYTKENDALVQDWRGFVFVNPPYGRGVGDWVKKASEESMHGATVVMLLPVRTDTAWWWDYVQGKAEVRFLRGRLKFGHPNGTSNCAPFPSCVIIFRPGSEDFWKKGGVHEAGDGESRAGGGYRQTSLFPVHARSGCGGGGGNTHRRSTKDRRPSKKDRHPHSEASA